MLEYRLPSAHVPESEYRLLAKDFVAEAVKRLGSRLPECGGNYYVRRATRNVSDDDRETVIEWVRDLNLPPEKWANVFWIADKEGICASLNNFVENYDDLWYPGADDVWICPSDEAWVLEFSHEEDVSFFSRVEGKKTGEENGTGKKTGQV